MPAGFAVGVSSTINEIEEGLVITDAIDENHRSIGNEFVWVPVPEFSEFKRYDFLNNSEVSTSYTEPSADGIANTTEVEKMYKSVRDNGGFYIGRYEAGVEGEARNESSGINDEVVIKKGKNVYNYIKWGNSMTDETGGAVEVARSMYSKEKGDSVTSTLCYGVQWDAVMRWMKDVPNIDNPAKKYVQDSRGMGWYFGVSGNSYQKTGIDLIGENGVIKNKVKNIYDMAGNVAEWTMETCNTNLRATRGRLFKIYSCGF